MVRQSETQITFRLPKALADRIDKHARASSRGRSEVMREAIEVYLDAAMPDAKVRPADRVRSLIGSLHTDRGDRVQNHSEYLQRVIRERVIRRGRADS